MRKVKLIFALLLVISFVAIALMACSEGLPADVADLIDDAGSSSSSSLPKIHFDLDNSGFAISYEGDYSFYLKTDDGDTSMVLPGFFFDFSEEIGDHVVYAYAANAAGEKVAEGTLRYRAVEISLSDPVVSGLEVTWTAEAKSVSVKEKGGYVPVAGNTYFAEQEGVTITIKAEGGFDEANMIYYVGDPIVKRKSVITSVSAPILKFEGNTVTWRIDEDATDYMVAYDGGAFASALSATLSSVIGAHKLEIKAIGNGVTYSDNSTVLEYETLVNELQVSKVAEDKVLLYADYLSFSFSADGKNYKAIEGTEYLSKVTTPAYFRSNAGYISTEKKYYLESEPYSTYLTVAAKSDVVIEAGANAGKWSLSVGDTLSNLSCYDGSAALGLNTQNDNHPHAFSIPYTLTDSYETISFIYRGDGISSLTVSLTKQGSDFVLTRDLGTMPDYWVTVTLPINDDGWMAGERTLRDLWDAKGSVLEEDAIEGLPERVSAAYSPAELVAFFDHLTLTTQGNAPQAASTCLALSDLRFGYQDADFSLKQPLYDIGDTYVAREEIGASGTNDLILILNDEERFSIYSTALAENFTLTGSYHLYAEECVLIVEDPEMDFTMELAFSENGRSLVVRSATGANAAHFPKELLLEKAASLDIDCEESSAVADGWSAYTYSFGSDEWSPLATSPISDSTRNGSGVMGFRTGKDVVYKIVYNDAGEKVGLANYFSLEIGNYDEDAEDILVKIVAHDVFGVSHYLKGSENVYWTLSSGNDFERIEYVPDTPILLRSLVIIAEYRGNNARANLYLDNLSAEYQADPSLFSDYPAPEIEVGEFALNFSHKERATIEYSVNGGEWIAGEMYPIPSVDGFYTVRVRALLEANGAVTAVAVHTFRVEKVYISQIAIEIGEAGQTASWRSNGVIEIAVDKKVNEVYVPGDYDYYDESYYFTKENAILHVRASGYFDEEADTYYVGTVQIEKKIIVSANLATPVIVPTSEGLTWEEVEDANAYAVSVNGGDEVIRADRTLAFAITEAEYSVRVRAVAVENDEVISYGNFSAPYLYTVKNVAFTKAPAVDKDTLSWTALSYKAFVIDNAAPDKENALGSYVVDVIGAHKLRVKLTGGFSFDEKVYYYAENDVISDELTVVVENLLTPTLLLHTGSEGTDGLYWAYLNDEKEIVHNVGDMRSVHPFLSYSMNVKVWDQLLEAWVDLDSENEWTKLSSDIYLFKTLSEGKYAITIKANGNGANYRDSYLSNTVVFEVKYLQLSEISVEIGEGGSTASYDYVSLRTKRKIGTNGAFSETAERTFTATATTWITIRVEGGWDASRSIYYTVEDTSATENALEKSKQIIVPIRLSAPLVTPTASRIDWKKVEHATAYRVTVNGDPETTTDLHIDYQNGDGDYIVEIVAINETNAPQYPESDPVTITYHVIPAVINEVSHSKTSVVWTYTGKLSRRLGETGAWEDYPYTEYVNESGSEETLYLKTEGTTVIDEDEVYIYYVANDSDANKSWEFTAYTLLAPEMTLNADGDSYTKLSWSVNAKANEYRYTLLSLDATEEEIAAAEATLESWRVASENYITFKQETHGEKLFLIKAIGDGANITDSPTTKCGLRAVSISEKEDIAISEEGVATWTKSGITSIQKSTNPEKEGYGKYETIRESYYAPGVTTWINLRCAVGYDEVDGIWYFGKTLVRENIKITVPKPLGKPVLEMRDTGIYISFVENADAYKYSVNGGAEQSINKDQNRTIPYATSVGTYTLTVRAVNNDPDEYPDSAVTEFTYEVKSVSLSEITADNVNGVAYFTAVGILTLQKEGGAPISKPTDTTSYAPDETTTLTVTASTGYDPDNQVYYIGETLSTSKKIIVPTPLKAPTLTKGADNISISPVADKKGYRVKVDNGGWIDQTADTIAYSSTSGTHTVRVKAYADDSVQYPDSEEVSISYTTASVAISLNQTVGATVSWTASAASVKIKVGSKDYVEIGETSYTVSDEGTTTIYLRAYSGYRSDNDTYYHHSTPYKLVSTSVTISKLATPSLSVSGSKITWSAISGASGYEVKVGSGSYISQDSTEKALSNQEGKYKVYVRAKGNGTTVLSSDAALLEYTTKNVTLTDITVSGTTASWTSVAYKTSLSVDGGSYSQTTATSYTPTVEGTHTIKVKAEGGWNGTSKIYYYASKAIEKSATVKLLKLSKPSLSTNDKGIIWSAVTNAASYAVKVDGGNYKSQTDRSVTFSTVSGTHTVYVKAVGASSSGYQDSEVATFTYETKQTSLTFLSTTSTTATWNCVGLKAQYSEAGGTYKDALYSGYTATKSGSVSFKAVGGYDANAKVFYNGTTAATSKSFSLSGMTINNNFENGTGTWKREKFGTSDWESVTTTSVSSVADANGAGSAMMLQTYYNGMAYRFGYSFGNMPATYYSMSFDVKVGDYSGGETILRFQDNINDNNKPGAYVDYNLKHLNLTPGVWYHVVLSFRDSHITINFNNKDYPVQDMIKQYGESTVFSKIKALDHIYITVKGNYGNGPKAFTYFDNFMFSTSSVSTSAKKINSIEKNFSDGTVGENYTASGWKSYKYDSSFVENPNVMKIEDGAKVLSLYCGGTTSKITYNAGGSTLGEFNHFQIDIGTEASKVSYSIELTTESGNVIYVAGGAEYRATLSNTSGVSGMKTIVFNFSAVKIKSITIYASESSGNGHFYMDNIIFAKQT